MVNLEFKYFQNVKENARFTEELCNICSSPEHCLVGAYFETGDDPDSVCVECVRTGRFVVKILKRVQVSLAKSIRDTYPELSDVDIEERKKRLVQELERTPPVPWIQYNEWPSYKGDFMKFVGEWDQNSFNEASSNGDGKTFLISILEQSFKDTLKDVDGFWNSIGDMTAVYVFRCITSNTLVAIPQSY